MHLLFFATMKASLVLAIATAVVLGAGAPLSAQDAVAVRGPIFVRVGPRVGLVFPDPLLYEQFANFSGDGPVEWTDGVLGRAPVLGLSFEVGRVGGGVLLRGEVLRSVGGWLYVSHAVVVPRQLFDPPFIQTTWLDIPTAVTMTSLQLVMPTRLTLWRSQPYVLAGVSGKRYGFGDPTTTNEVAAILPESGITWGGDVGAGLTVPVPGLILDLQGRDAINRYWGTTQHDLVFSMGLIRRIR